MKKIFAFLLAFCLLMGTACPGWTAKAAPSKLIAITYDDGPDDRETERLLDGLKARGVQATFFLMGKKISGREEIVARMYREGHQVGNHSYSHRHLTELSPDEVRKDVQAASALLDGICGVGTNYMVRPPFGAIDDETAQATGLPCITWSMSPLDWIDKDAAVIEKRLLDKVRPGDVILVHDTVPWTVDATLAAIDKLKARGYEFVTVKELFRRQGMELKNGKWTNKPWPKGTPVRLGPVKTPNISYSAGEGGLTVSISSPDKAPIYYSTDGSDINQESPRYTEAFTVAGPCVVQAYAAYDMNGSRSKLAKLCYSPLGNVFRDVFPTDWYFDAMDQSAAMGIISGQGDGVFAPMSPCTRGQIVTLLWNAAGKPEPENRENPFTDVSEKEFYYKPVMWAVENNITGGTSATTFSPKSPCTRGQAMTFLWKAAGSPDPLAGISFDDVAPGSYYEQAVSWAAENGITSGTGAAAFSPGKSCTRGEIVTFLYNAKDL